MPQLLVYLLCSMLTASLQALELQNPSQANANNYSPVPQSLPFITAQDNIDGTVTPAVLAKKIKRAQLKFYKAYNKINELDEYDIICRRRWSLSHRSENKVCEPAYSRKLRLHLENVNNERSSANLQRFRQLTLEKNQHALAQLTHLIGKNPELNKQYSDLLAMTQHYQTLTGRQMAAFCPGIDSADYFLDAN